MNKKLGSWLVMVLVLSFGVGACNPAETGLTAADVGIRLARAVREAKAKHPDDFVARAEIYAGLYCELRDDRRLEWSAIRDKARDAGAPGWAIDQVKTLIDRKCGNAHPE